MIKTKYSQDVDALIIQLTDKPIDVAEEHGQYIFHYSSDGELVLLEILGGREFLLSVMTSVFDDRMISKG
jgi:hypothetical protein